MIHVNDVCRDISSSAVLFIYLQGWQSVSVTIITIASVSFFNYVGQSGVSAALSWTPIALLVFLPLVVLAYLVSQTPMPYSQQHYGASLRTV